MNRKNIIRISLFLNIATFIILYISGLDLWFREELAFSFATFTENCNRGLYSLFSSVDIPRREVFVGSYDILWGNIFYFLIGFTPFIILWLQTEEDENSDKLVIDKILRDGSVESGQDNRITKTDG